MFYESGVSLSKKARKRERRGVSFS
jgi:hypothetical protein